MLNVGNIPTDQSEDNAVRCTVTLHTVGGEVCDTPGEDIFGPSGFMFVVGGGEVHGTTSVYGR